jgi:hypothetical protein
MSVSCCRDNIPPMIALRFLCLFVFVGQVAAQTEHGTIAVIYFSNDNANKIVMAADSREIFGKDRPPDDKSCKIAAPHGKLLFVSSGLGGYNNGGFTDPVQTWWNADEIRSAYDIISNQQTTARGRLVGSAHEWGKLVSGHLQSLFRWHPEMVLADAAKNENGGLTKGFIGGLDDDGRLLLLRVVVSLHGDVVSYQVNSTGCPDSLCPLGDRVDTGVAQEFINKSTPRAKREAAQWKPPSTAKPEEYDILKTIRIAEMVVRYGSSEVGGKVDAVEMDKTGNVRWFAIKNNCRKD